MMNRKALNRRKVLDIRIGRLVQAHIAVAGLQNGETLLPGGHCLVRNEPRLAINDTPLLGWVRS